MLANMTLDGLETAVKTSVPKNAKVNVIRYADDFVVTGESKEILKEKVMPVIHTFLKERGLQLSGEKTKITRIEDGFDFLGQRVRKHREKFITIPSKSSVKSLLAKIKKIVNAHLGTANVNNDRSAQPRIEGMGELSQACLLQENL